MSDLPILYSFRRCPYAMRARLALLHAGIRCEMREILLKAKPSQMLDVSNKGTVPVLVLINGEVIDESLDIMHWALSQTTKQNKTPDSQDWLMDENLSKTEINLLIERNDYEFKEALDKFKYFDRHPENPQNYYLEQAMPYLETLENILQNNVYLGGSQFRLLDAAALPFIRQFSMVDQQMFNALPLKKLQIWLENGLNSELFKNIMPKYPLWEPDNPLVTFGYST